jgi:glycosyltransferase involved in cell wall biosynthesis
MYKSTAPQRNSRSHYSKFRRSVKISDLVIAGNNYLAEQANKFNDNVRILPTGLDTAEYQIDTEKPDDKIRLVWIGSTSTLGYLEQLKPVLEEIGRENENVILRIICDTFFDMRNMPIEKKPWSKQTQAHDLRTADVGLAPLPDNRFTRGKCGFKILQYASAGLPVIASPVGVNRELVKEDETGFCAESQKQWHDCLKKLIQSAGLRQTMGQKNREFAENFDVNVIGEKLSHILRESNF